MQEAQRRLSYNVSIGNQQQSKHQQQQQQLAQNQYQSERQKILNRTSNCYEQSSRLSQMINPVKFPVTEDFDSEVLDINVDDINYEDDDIFGDEDEEQPQQPAQHYHQQQQHYQQNPNKKHIQLDLTVHKQVKSSSESSASTSTSSISAMSNTHAHTHIHTQTNNCNRPTYLKHLKQNDTTTDNTKQNNSNATTTTNNNNHQQQQQSASVSPFTASNSSSSISYASNQHSQIKKFKYPIPPLTYISHLLLSVGSLTSWPTRSSRSVRTLRTSCHLNRERNQLPDWVQTLLLDYLQGLSLLLCTLGKFR